MFSFDLLVLGLVVGVLGFFCISWYVVFVELSFLVILGLVFNGSWFFFCL